MKNLKKHQTFVLLKYGNLGIFVAEGICDIEFKEFFEAGGPHWYRNLAKASWQVSCQICVQESKT